MRNPSLLSAGSLGGIVSGIAEFRNSYGTGSGGLGLLAVISSGWFYDEVIWLSDPSQADSYVGVEMTHNETTTRAWIRVWSTAGGSAQGVGRGDRSRGDL